MSNILKELTDKGLISPPSWLPLNTQQLSIVGSTAYGVATDDSDFDVFGWAIPKKVEIFPHLNGEILGFGKQKKRFESYEKDHVFDKDALGGKGREYDFNIFSIVKYFNLVLQNNPNCLDTLFVPQSCILHITNVGQIVRENRKMFLHKGCYRRFKGYAYSQLHKMNSKEPTGKRKKIREAHGFDSKFAYHIVRLLSEVEQLMAEGDLDLQEKSRREHMKAIRRGEVSMKEIKSWVNSREPRLEKLYAECKLPEQPDEEKVKELLLNCLEEHYGSMDDCIKQPDWAVSKLKEVDVLLDGVRSQLYNS